MSDYGLVHSVMPIIDMAVPDNVHDAFELISSISADVGAGQGVLVHCMQGVGRAGMIAACVLLHLGCAANATCAIQTVRKKRHKRAVQTSRQEEFVHWYAANMMVNPITSLSQRLPFASCAHRSTAISNNVTRSPLPGQQHVDVRDTDHTRARESM